MIQVMNRQNLELKLIHRMITLYCRRHHGTLESCPSCSELYDYTRIKIEHCPYRNMKISCKKCPTHCYRDEYRERIRQVMRYAGPRILFIAPLQTLGYLFYRKKAELRSR